VSGEEVVLGLLDDGSDEVESVGDGPGLGDLLRGPLGGAPVEGPALVDDPVDGAHRLLDGRGGVGAVAVDDVDVVHVEAAERGAEALDDVLAGEALVVGALAAPEELGGDDDVGAAPAQVPDGLAHDLLGAAVGVHLGVVEEVDARVPARLQQRLGLLHVQLVPEGHPRAVRELADAEPRPAQVLVLHPAFLHLASLVPRLEMCAEDEGGRRGAGEPAEGRGGDEEQLNKPTGERGGGRGRPDAAAHICAATDLDGNTGFGQVDRAVRGNHYHEGVWEEGEWGRELSDRRSSGWAVRCGHVGFPFASCLPLPPVPYIPGDGDLDRDDAIAGLRPRFLVALVVCV
jgi:hypothetical protein